jgi:hypothetical protein
VISINPLASTWRRRSGRSGTGLISTGTIWPFSPLEQLVGVTSCRRATIETDPPGSSVSATIWRFNASDQLRRFAKRGAA